MKRLVIFSICALFLSAAISGCGDEQGDDVNGPVTTGSIQVTTITTGQDLDPDGYTCRLDGTQSWSIGINDAQTHTGIETGSHSVELTGVEANCTVSGGATRSVTVRADQPAEVSYSVACEPLTGSLQIAFRTYRDGNWEIYVMEADGSNQRNLTLDPGVDSSPVWGPPR